MTEFTAAIGAFLGLLAIIFGAFGAHALKKIFTVDQQQSFETGVKYQMYHAITLVVLGNLFHFSSGLEKGIVYCLLIGTLLFSFSIYGLCLSGAKGNKWRFLGPITPLGGLLMVLGWGLLVYRFMI